MNALVTTMEIVNITIELMSIIWLPINLLAIEAIP